jgi:hypothetical protein
MGEVKQENSPKRKSQLLQQAGWQETEQLAQQSIPSKLGNQIISRIGNTPSQKAHADMLNRAPASNKQLLLQLQRQYGNSYVQQVVQQARQQERSKIQTKLTIGEPGDRYEQEADRVAQQVVQQINAPALPLGQGQAMQRQMPKEEELAQMKAEAELQRQMPEEKKEDELQMKPMVQRQADAGPDVEASINQARGGGQPLAENIRKPMEKAFGADFSGVKVHTDVQSDQLNQSIQARAFTTGQDVFFGQGEYNPGSQGGQELIAHELTHVVQQSEAANLLASKVLQRTLENSGKESEFFPLVPKLTSTDEHYYYFYHGTFAENIEGIQEKGLDPQEGGGKKGASQYENISSSDAHKMTKYATDPNIAMIYAKEPTKMNPPKVGVLLQARAKKETVKKLFNDQTHRDTSDPFWRRERGGENNNIIEGISPEALALNEKDGPGEQNPIRAIETNIIVPPEDIKAVGIYLPPGVTVNEQDILGNLHPSAEETIEIVVVP